MSDISLTNFRSGKSFYQQEAQNLLKKTLKKEEKSTFEVLINTCIEEQMNAYRMVTEKYLNTQSILEKCKEIVKSYQSNEIQMYQKSNYILQEKIKFQQQNIVTLLEEQEKVKDLSTEVYKLKEEKMTLQKSLNKAYNHIQKLESQKKECEKNTVNPKLLNLSDKLISKSQYYTVSRETHRESIVKKTDVLKGDVKGVVLNLQFEKDDPFGLNDLKSFQSESDKTFYENADSGQQESSESKIQHLKMESTKLKDMYEEQCEQNITLKSKFESLKENYNLLSKQYDDFANIFNKRSMESAKTIRQLQNRLSNMKNLQGLMELLENTSQRSSEGNAFSITEVQKNKISEKTVQEVSLHKSLAATVDTDSFKKDP